MRRVSPDSTVGIQKHGLEFSYLGIKFSSIKKRWLLMIFWIIFSSLYFYNSRKKRIREKRGECTLDWKDSECTLDWNQVDLPVDLLLQPSPIFDILIN